jgi:hypothetical protein
VSLVSGTIDIAGDAFNFSDSNITVTGGTLNVDGPLDLSTAAGKGLTVSGGTVNFDDEFKAGNVMISGGTMNFNSCCGLDGHTPAGSWEITGGTVNVNEDLTVGSLVWSEGGSIAAGLGKTATFGQ